MNKLANRDFFVKVTIVETAVDLKIFQKDANDVLGSGEVSE